MFEKIIYFLYLNNLFRVCIFFSKFASIFNKKYQRRIFFFKYLKKKKKKNKKKNIKNCLSTENFYF